MMRAASAGPMPGSFSSSSRDERFMEISGAPSDVREARVTCVTSDEARRGRLTQEGGGAGGAPHRVIQPGGFRKRVWFPGGKRSSQRGCDFCRGNGENARRLKIVRT